MAQFKKFSGTWILTENGGTNYDEYLQKIEISWLERIFAKHLGRKLEIQCTGENSFDLIDQVDSCLLPFPALPSYQEVIFGKTFQKTRKDGVILRRRYERRYSEGKYRGRIHCFESSDDLSAESVWELGN